MRLNLLIITLLFSLENFAQDHIITIGLNEKYSQNNSDINEYYFSIKPVDSSQKPYHFQYQTLRQIVELYSDDGQKFSGQIINFVQGTKEVKSDYGVNHIADNYIFDKVKIPDSSASEIAQLIIHNQSFLIPTDTLIKNWNHNFLNCGSVKFTYKINADTHSKSYRCISSQQDSINDVAKITGLSASLNETLKLAEVFSEFTNKLPKGRHYLLDGWIGMYTLSEKEWEGWKQYEPIREYQKSIKDTIDSYLEKELNKLIPNSSEINCYDGYRLTFSKNGKLKKIKASMSFWERVFDKDYNKCRRRLRKAFSKIRIDFVDPKFEFYRDLHFGLEEIYITDPTMY